MKKTRLWICRKCKYVFGRKKYMKYCSCPYCRGSMKKATKYPSDEWFERAERIRKSKKRKEERFSKRISVPRDSHNKVLQITPELKRIWKKIRTIKQVPALQRWATKFIAELHTNCIHRLGVNGMVNPPEIRIETYSSFQKGSYHASLVRGCYITLHRHKGKIDIEDMKATLLHEAQHHIDGEANDRHGHTLIPAITGHDEDWRNRLRRFKKMLRVKSEYILYAK